MSARRFGCRTAAIALALLTASCVRFGYGVTHLEEPLDPAALQSLRPGVDDLGTCLQRLGAPHHVFEYRGSGVALAWHYSDGSDLDIDISYSLPRQISGASFSLDWDDTTLPGAVLWFDADLRLIEWKQGNMRDLTADLRRRPHSSESTDG